MFKIIITTTDHATGNVSCSVHKHTYKTRNGAEKAAEKMRYICSPDGKKITMTRDADVVEVCHA